MTRHLQENWNRPQQHLHPSVWVSVFTALSFVSVLHTWYLARSTTQPGNCWQMLPLRREKNKSVTPTSLAVDDLRVESGGFVPDFSLCPFPGLLASSKSRFSISSVSLRFFHDHGAHIALLQQPPPDLWYSVLLSQPHV